MNRTYNIAFVSFPFQKIWKLPFLSVDLAETVGDNASCLAEITVSELPLGTIGKKI